MVVFSKHTVFPPVHQFPVMTVQEEKRGGGWVSATPRSEVHGWLFQALQDGEMLWLPAETASLGHARWLIHFTVEFGCPLVGWMATAVKGLVLLQGGSCPCTGVRGIFERSFLVIFNMMAHSV